MVHLKATLMYNECMILYIQFHKYTTRCHYGIADMVSIRHNACYRVRYFALYMQSHCPLKSILTFASICDTVTCGIYIYIYIYIYVYIYIWSTSPQVMACHLTAPIHYLNHCWLINNEARWHLAGVNFTEIVLDITDYSVSESTYLKILLHLQGSH